MWRPHQVARSVKFNVAGLDGISINNLQRRLNQLGSTSNLLRNAARLLSLAQFDDAPRFAGESAWEKTALATIV